MPKCAYCGTTIVFGGVKDDGQRYCNDECHQQGILISVARQLPEVAVREAVLKTHQGHCPGCDGSGPVDVFVSYRVWSAILLTSSSNTPRIGCRRCAVRRQLGDMFFSLLFGWWGLPWGPIMTPVQIVRNLFAMGRQFDHFRPSDKLEELVRAETGAKLIE